MLADVMFDSTCVVCRRRGRLLCVDCAALLNQPHSVTHEVAGVPVYAVGWYQGELRTVVRRAKNYRSRAVIAHLEPSLNRVFARFDRVPVIPVPPSKPGMLRRGYGLARPIATVSRLPIVDVLRIRDSGTQRGRRADERSRGREFQVRGKVPTTAVLVDDVVTTGATVSAAITALAESGCRVIAVVALALVASR